MEHLQTLPGRPGLIYGVRYSPDGSLLAAGGAFRSVQLYNTESRKLEVKLKYRDKMGARSLRFTPDGRKLFAALPNAIRWWNRGKEKWREGGILTGHTEKDWHAIEPRRKWRSAPSPAVPPAGPRRHHRVTALP